MGNKEKKRKEHVPSKYEKGMFSLKARARDKYGNLIWNS